VAPGLGRRRRAARKLPGNAAAGAPNFHRRGARPALHSLAMDGSMTAPIVVVGAGVAGLACAGALAAAGRAVLVLERARGVGGRCATRRLDGQPLDSGPVFLHGRDPEFLALLDEVPGTRHLGWPAAVEGAGQPCQPHAFEPGERRLAWAEGVNALPRHLARGLAIRLETPVTALEASPAGLRVRHGEGGVLEASAVVLAGAPEQSTALLDTMAGSPPSVAGVRALLGLARTQSCLALLALYPHDAPRPAWHVCYPERSPLMVLSHDSAKRAAGARLALVLQARAGWSREHLEDPAWPEALLAEAGRLLGPWAARPTHTHAHRWLHARHDGAALLSGPLLLPVPGGRLGLCGDRFGRGGGVEGAWRSGRTLAGRMLAGDRGP
jgi:renalase